MSIKTVKSAMLAQWQKMLAQGIMPCIEYRLPDNDWLLVEISLPVTVWRDAITGEITGETLEASHIAFSFNQADNTKVYFSGTIKGKCGHYRMPLDEYFDNLDYYLQEIDQEIIQGYLIPNGLYYPEGE